MLSAQVLEMWLGAPRKKTVVSLGSLFKKFIKPKYSQRLSGGMKRKIKIQFRWYCIIFLVLPCSFMTTMYFKSVICKVWPEGPDAALCFLFCGPWGTIPLMASRHSFLLLTPMMRHHSFHQHQPWGHNPCYWGQQWGPIPPTSTDDRPYFLPLTPKMGHYPSH